MIHTCSKEGCAAHYSDHQFTKIIESYTAHLQFTAWRITRNKQVSEDIVQEAFLALWKQWASVVPDNPVGWLVKVVTNLSARYVKRKNIQIRIHKALREHSDTSCRQVEEYLNTKEKKELLNDVFNQLPPQQKIVLHFSKNLGLKREEIALCLQLSPNTVKVHLQRAMQFMKEHLACIVIILMLFICNNIYFKSGNTNDDPGEQYIISNLKNINKQEEMESTALTAPVASKGMMKTAISLLKR